MYTYYLMKLEKGNNLQRMLKTVFIFANIYRRNYQRKKQEITKKTKETICIYHRNYQRKEQEITKKTKEAIWSECKHVFVYIYMLKLQKVE